MDNEKYGIELELVTNKFNQKMQEVKSSFSSLTDKKVNLNANTAQIEYLRRQIGELTADLQVNAKRPFWNTTETARAQAQLEKLTNQYNKLIAKQNQVGVSASKATTGISKDLSKMTSKIKRFGLSLLSVRSIFSLVSRASSAYLAQDTELADRLQSVWAGLGAMLAPIIERIVDILAKGVIYINIFIKALTGVDLLSKASAKSMKAAAGSARALNKALAGFDELNNLDTDTGGGTGGIGGGLAGLADIEVDTEWTERIKGFGEWVEQHKGSILTFLTTIASPISVGAIIKYWDTISDYLHGFVDDLENKSDFIHTTFGDTIGSIYDMAVFDIKSTLTWLDELVKGTKQITKGIIDIITGVFTQDWEKAWKGLKDVTDGIITIIGATLTMILERIINKVKTIGTTVGEAVSKAFKAVVNSVLGAMERFLNAPIRAVNALIGVINQLPGAGGISRLSTFSFPRLNVGTNYVPEDQLAMIHKGEAVVPKKFNSKEYFGSGNDETNELLKELITRVEQIEINPYTTIQDVGKASLSYINNKSRQLGESVVI